MIPAPVGHQCPGCVAEARREFQRGPGRRVAVANVKSKASFTMLLLLMMGAMFILEVLAGGPGALMNGPSGLKLIDLGASVAVAQTPGGDLVGIATGQYWRLFSAMFLHAGIIHIAFNAYALWIFGRVVEEELGSLRFALIFLTTGIFASAASYAFGPNAVGVGASGAIFGVFGAFVAYNYRRRHLAIAAARLRSAMVLVVVNMLIAFSIPGIDWRAHVGGFVSGLVAGFVAEGVGTPSQRRAILVLGFAGILAGAFVLVAWHTARLHSQFPGLG
jgi:membrane associated rhomboid family serine protease